MAKISKATVVLSKNGTEIMSYETTQTPKKTTLGNAYFGAINSAGIAHAQKILGYSLLSEKEWVALISEKTGIPVAYLGNRGPSWNSEEARAVYTATVGGAPFNPPLGKSAKSADVESFDTPVVESAAEIVQPEISANAEPLNDKDKQVVKLAKALLSTGVVADDVVTKLKEAGFEDVRIAKIMAVAAPVAKPVEAPAKSPEELVLEALGGLKAPATSIVPTQPVVEQPKFSF